MVGSSPEHPAEVSCGSDCARESPSSMPGNVAEGGGGGGKGADGSGSISLCLWG